MSTSQASPQTRSQTSARRVSIGRMRPASPKDVFFLPPPPTIATTSTARNEAVEDAQSHTQRLQAAPFSPLSSIHALGLAAHNEWHSDSSNFLSLRKMRSPKPIRSVISLAGSLDKLSEGQSIASRLEAVGGRHFGTSLRRATSCGSIQSLSESLGSAALGSVTRGGCSLSTARYSAVETPPSGADAFQAAAGSAVQRAPVRAQQFATLAVRNATSCTSPNGSSSGSIPGTQGNTPPPLCAYPHHPASDCVRPHAAVSASPMRPRAAISASSLAFGADG